jgi:hypothetical protein
VGFGEFDEETQNVYFSNKQNIGYNFLVTGSYSAFFYYNAFFKNKTTPIHTKKIIDNTCMYLNEDIENLTFKESVINSFSASPFKLLSEIARLRLIKNQQFCDKCQNQKNNEFDTAKRCVILFLWVCTKKCVYSCSVRKGSMFEGFRSKFNKILLAFYKYVLVFRLMTFLKN